jgi:hypothetical protein
MMLRVLIPLLGITLSAGLVVHAENAEGFPNDVPPSVHAMGVYVEFDLPMIDTESSSTTTTTTIHQPHPTIHQPHPTTTTTTLAADHHHHHDVGNHPYREAVERWRPLVNKHFLTANDRHRAMHVLRCESVGDPDALNPSSVTRASGLFQMHMKYWVGRLTAAGEDPKASPFNPEINVRMAAWLVYENGGWRHWPNCGADNGSKYANRHKVSS